jgi:hypothetical protein
MRPARRVALVLKLISGYSQKLFEVSFLKYMDTKKRGQVYTSVDFTLGLLILKRLSIKTTKNCLTLSYLFLVLRAVESFYSTDVCIIENGFIPRERFRHQLQTPH